MRITLLPIVLLTLCTSLLPSLARADEAKTIAETAVESGQFKTLVAAAKAAGLAGALAGDGPLTVLAPTDDAFAKLPDGTVDSLLKPENKEKLANILKLHVASGRLTSNMAEPDGQFPNLLGESLTVGVDQGKITIGAASVVKADIVCSNGVIHVIDTVLLPPAKVELKQLVGKWSYTKAVKNGETKSADQLAGQSVEISETSWTLGGDAKFVMDYSIDNSVSPNAIKFTITQSPFGAGMSTGGVVKMDGDQLVVCYSASGGEAPTEFSSDAGSGFHLFYLNKQ